MIVPLLNQLLVPILVTALLVFTVPQRFLMATLGTYVLLPPIL